MRHKMYMPHVYKFLVMSLRVALIYSFLIIGLTYLFNQIPLSDVLEVYFDLQKAELIENILFFIFLSCCTLYIIKRFNIPIYFLDKNAIFKIHYFIPVILFFLIFSGVFSNFYLLDENFLRKPVNLLYTLEEFLGAAFEEILFRGFVLGILLLSLYNENMGLIKAIVISGLLFGLTHIINLKTFEGNNIGNVFNQVYGTASIGIMWACVYYKTRSLLVLVLIHFANNFFAGLEAFLSLPLEQISNASESVKSTSNYIISEVIRVIIFGLPAVLGFMILFIPSDQDNIKWRLKLERK